MSMKTSAEGLAFTTAWEGQRSRKYRCQAGHWTIGVGHKLTPAENTSGVIVIAGERVPFDGGLTDAQIAALLAQDKRRYESAVWHRMQRGGVPAPMKQHEFDALVSYAFNIGATAFLNLSSVPKLLLEGKPDPAFGIWRSWNKVTDPATKRKVVSEGLDKRRAAEIALYRTGDYTGKP
jgi:lysozyme